MALPASVPTGTVTGTWYTPSGALAVGTIVFLLLESVEIPDDPDGVVIPVRTVVDVPAGQLNQTLPTGTYQVSVRLSELYRINKVVEIETGVALNLPDAVGLLLPDPDLYDPVRSVDGYFPDAYGNIDLPVGGGGGITSVNGDVGPVVVLTAAEVGAANLVHTHVISDVTSLQTALDAKQASGDYATNTALTDGLALKQNVGDYATNTALNAVKRRVTIVRDTSQSPGYAVVGNGDTWALLATSPEYTIAAVAGEHIDGAYNTLVANEADWGMDLVVVTGGSPTIQRYMATNTSTPATNGNPNNYPVGQPFIGRSGVFGFVAAAGDIDGGNIRFRWAVKAVSAGTLYASTGFPLVLNINNNRVPA